jgi:hypothetical protein
LWAVAQPTPAHPVRCGARCEPFYPLSNLIPHHSEHESSLLRSLLLAPWCCSPSRAWRCPLPPRPSHPTTTAPYPPLYPPPPTRSQPPPPSPASELRSPSAPSRRPPSLQFLTVIKQLPPRFLFFLFEVVSFWHMSRAMATVFLAIREQKQWLLLH